MKNAIDLDLEAHKLIESLRLSLSESRLEIVKRALRSAAKAAAPGVMITSAAPVPERRTGTFPVTLGGSSVLATSQKDAYKKVLNWLADRDETFLSRLGEEISGSRRIVARSHETLYPRKPQLAHKLSPELLRDGWYVDLNLSKDQKIKRLMTACAITGLEYGKDVVVRFD